MKDFELAPTDQDVVDGYSDDQDGTVSQPDPGESKMKPMDADERAKAEAEIRADGGDEDLKK